MRIMQLLAVGKSICNVVDRMSPYRVTRENLVPNFHPPESPKAEGDEAAPEAAAAGATAELARPGTPDAAPSPSATAVVPRPESAEDARPATMAKTAYPLGRWTMLRNPFVRKSAVRADRVPMQTELPWASIQVARNDLNEADLEVIQPQPKPVTIPPGPTAGEAPASASLLLARIRMRFFGTVKS